MRAHVIPPPANNVSSWTIAGAAPLQRGATVVRALFELTKPRLALFSLLTAMAAFILARSPASAASAWLTLLGTALSAGGALSLNQWWERRTDALMRRTRKRPLPSHTLAPAVAFAWSASLSLGGVSLLAFTANLTAAALAAATILIYGVIYTPLKRRTRWATEIGSISGALPPLIGSAAAGDVLHPSALLLAAVLVFWQMPHFFAIGWMYRRDYYAAGFPLLPATDPTGVRTARWSLGYTFGLIAVSLLGAPAAQVGPIYYAAALLGGAFFLERAWRFLRDERRRDEAARRLFLASICYLPLLLSALLLEWILG